MAQKKRKSIDRNAPSLIFPTRPVISIADFAPLLDRQSRFAGIHEIVSTVVNRNSWQDLYRLKVSGLPRRGATTRKK